MRKKFTENDLLNRIVGAYFQSGSINLTKLADSLDIPVYLKSDGPTKSVYNAELDQFEIYVNPNEPSIKQRFAIAHEIARILMYQDKPERLPIPTDSGGGIILPVAASIPTEDAPKEIPLDDGVKLERTANAVATKILMPKEALEDFFEKEKITRDRPIDADVLKKLVDYFKVSDPVVISRLKELGYYVPFVQF